MYGKDIGVFDPLTQKVSYNRNVKFDEQENKPSVEKESVLILTPINEIQGGGRQHRRTAHC